MNLFSFVGEIAFCPEFARRNGSTAFSRMDAAWMRAYLRAFNLHWPHADRHNSSKQRAPCKFSVYKFHLYRYSRLHDEKGISRRKGNILDA